MSTNHRRMVGIAGMAVGAMLAPPLIALLASPVANADPSDASSVGSGDVTSYTLGDDTFSINTSTDGFDNYFAAPTYDLDFFSGGSPETTGFLLTDPGVFQLGYDVVGGTVVPIDDFTPADFINPDIGLIEIGGGGAVGADAVAGLFGL